MYRIIITPDMSLSVAFRTVASSGGSDKPWHAFAHDVLARTFCDIFNYSEDGRPRRFQLGLFSFRGIPEDLPVLVQAFHRGQQTFVPTYFEYVHLPLGIKFPWGIDD